ncbi:amino acid ABC transporter permease [Traorella massiliensis]|uniref:amino acid ABC transporter permease n=1 Tax=Traorella massiliensis TaxID=1903263 RepID=UPI0008F89774|nr:amino acid ABC transporter permease [Traorella massiliensis]
MNERLFDLLISSFGEIFIQGIKVTIPLTIISFLLAMIIALITAIVQVANIKVFKQLARFYVWIIRGTPLLVQLFVIFYGLPSLGIVLDAFPSAILVFSFNTGAYASETIRAAIEAVPKGQMEAGYCVGMNYIQIMRRIILPQALKTAFPPLSNSLIGLLKDTSLAASITIYDMFLASQRIAARTYETFALYLEVAVIYLIFCTVLTKLQMLCEKKLQIE